MLARTWKRVVWQRLPAERLCVRRPRLETALLLGYAVAYVGFSWLTGLAVRAHPRPILGAAYFTDDLVYVVAFKIGGLLVVPLAALAAFRYRLRDVFAGDSADRRELLLVLLAILAGASLNQQDFGPIAGALGSFAGPALLGRVMLGLFLPLLTAALPEEIFYRGLLQTRLERTAGRAPAVLGTALLFAAWHLPTRYLLASGLEGRAGDLASVLLHTGLPVFLVGLVFGLLYDRYRRLLPLVAAHWAIDATSSVALLLGLPV